MIKTPTASLIAMALYATALTAYAETPQGDATFVVDEDVIASAERHREHQRTLKELSDQLEVVQLQEQLADVMSSCYEIGVECQPFISNSRLNIRFVTEDSIPAMMRPNRTAATSRPTGVPAITGLGGNLTGRQLSPGDPGYVAEFESTGSQTPPPDEDDQSSDEAEKEAESTEKSEEKNSTETSKPLYNPILLGVENGRAVFRVSPEDPNLARVSSGQHIPGTKNTWKVTDVTFNYVMVNAPGEPNKKLHIDW